MAFNEYPASVLDGIELIAAFTDFLVRSLINLFLPLLIVLEVWYFPCRSQPGTGRRREQLISHYRWVLLV
jgi:hypothetical protein